MELIPAMAVYLEESPDGMEGDEGGADLCQPHNLDTRSHATEIQHLESTKLLFQHYQEPDNENKYISYIYIFLFFTYRNL